MKQIITHNAAEIRRLHQAIHDTWSHQSESRQAHDAWNEACAAFHARYDALAFPGGLSSALERLVSGDPLTAETAILFLELRPYFFRSQYIATKLTRRLKKLQLSSPLRQRFDVVLAAARQHKRRKTGNA